MKHVRYLVLSFQDICKIFSVTIRQPAAIDGELELPLCVVPDKMFEALCILVRQNLAGARP